VFLVHQVIQRLSQNWKRLKSAHLCGAVPLPQASKMRTKKTNAA
jgi:hypothetical protein